jgi:hypothetical protein
MACRNTPVAPLFKYIQARVKHVDWKPKKALQGNCWRETRLVIWRRHRMQPNFTPDHGQENKPMNS